MAKRSWTNDDEPPQPPSRDIWRDCVMCRQPFVFEEGEQRFYALRNLKPPLRCKSCRAARRPVTGY